MEFFQEITQANTDIQHLQRFISIRRLPELCDSITNIISDNGSQGEIYSAWGQFTIRRSEIRCGVRFELVNCPHAFAWTVTYDEGTDKIIVHCTIDKQHQDQDFIDSIEQFTKEWLPGLTKALE